MGAAPEFRRTPKPTSQEPGIGTLIAIEGLVELGMTPAQAIVAGDEERRDRLQALKDFGTLEAGKLADCWCSTPIRSPISRTSAS